MPREVNICRRALKDRRAAITALSWPSGAFSAGNESKTPRRCSSPWLSRSKRHCTGPAGVGALRDHPADSLVAPGTHAGLQPHREGLSGLRAHALYGAQAERA